MTPLTIQDAEYVAYRLAVQLNYDEPMDAFSTRYPHRLESCLAQPFATYDGVEFYPTLEEKAILLFYMVIKDHPFVNGNKRMAVMLMVVFIYTNNKALTASPNELYDLALLVAKSTRGLEDELSVLIKTLSQFIVDAK